MKKRPVICLVSSRGGHLFQLMQLKPWWKKYQRFWVVIEGTDTRSLLRNETMFFAHHPESRHLLNALKNTVLAIKILRAHRPTIVVSCGAGIAPPFFYVAKLLGIKTIFLEPYDFIQYPSLSGRLVAAIANHFFVQHPRQLRFYPKAQFIGSTL